MRSPRSLATVLAAVLAAALAGCGADTDPTCDRSFLRYDNFGAPFLLDWCSACHSAALPVDMRQQAPADVNFDTRADIARWSLAIRSTTGVGTSMPPEGGPSDAERHMLVEWLDCGAR
jgi:uncharacterized membrane protein